MARKLNGYVTVSERDEDGKPTGLVETFGPGDDLPEWAERAITNPDVWADEPAEPEKPAETQAARKSRRQ